MEETYTTAILQAEGLNATGIKVHLRGRDDPATTNTSMGNTSPAAA